MKSTMTLLPTPAALVAAILAVAPLSPAAAQYVTADVQQLATALQNNGYRATVEGEGARRHVATGTGGLNFTIHPFGCNAVGEDCKNVMMKSWFDRDEPPTLEAMNQFNARIRWGRAYIDFEGDPTIEMDLDLEDGGVSEQLFIDNIEYWDTALSAFADFLANGTLPSQ